MVPLTTFVTVHGPEGMRPFGTCVPYEPPAMMLEERLMMPELPESSVMAEPDVPPVRVTLVLRNFIYPWKTT